MTSSSREPDSRSPLAAPFGGFPGKALFAGLGAFAGKALGVGLGTFRRATPSSTLGAALLAPLFAACAADAGPTAFTESPTVVVEPYSTRLIFFGQTRSFTATVRDPMGNRISRPVRWSSSDPSVFTVDEVGTVTAVADGVAELRATAEGVSGTATVTVVQMPASVEAISGAGQDAVRGRALPEPIVVRVTDEGGSSMSGVTVGFAPGSGNGSASPASAETDANGEASTVWTLGDSLGAQTLDITAGDDVVNLVSARALPEAPIPDLLIVGGLKPPENDPTNLEAFGITLQVANEGNAPTPAAIPLTFTVDSTPAGAFEIRQLGAGESVEVTYSLGPLEAGDYEITADLDPSDAIEEWFDDNNEATMPLTVRHQSVLSVGDSLTLSSSTAGEVKLFRLDIAEPAQEALTVRLVGGEGDGDLFVHFGERPGHFHDYACPSGNPDTSELCHMMPTRAGSYHVAVHTVSAFGPSALRVTAGDEVEPFDIELVYASRLTPSQADIVRSAADRWESVLASGAEDVDFRTNSVPRGFCFAGSPAVDTVVDDLVILIDVRNIDGEGGTVVKSGPCVRRSVRFTGSGNIYQEVAVGSMMLDREDVRAMEFDGLLRAAMEHQMAHVLGFGFERLWGPKGLFRAVADPVADSVPDQFFSGPLAIAAFDAAGGSRYAGGGKVPVENAGTGIGEHWRRSVFGNELMTHLLTDGSPPLSLITIEAMADLGYGVDLTRADGYTLPQTGDLPAADRLDGPVLDLGDDLLRSPVMVVDREGRVLRVRGPRATADGAGVRR